MGKFAKYIGYIIVFLLSFILFFYLFFPYDALRERFLEYVEGKMNNTIKIEVGEFEPYYLTGVEMNNFDLYSREKENGGQIFHFDVVKMRAGIFSLLLFRPSFSFLLESEDGALEGSFDLSRNGWDIDLESKDFNLSTLKLLSTKYGLNLESSINGSIELSYDSTKPTGFDGNIDLTFDNLGLKESKVALAGSEIDFPKLTLAKGRNSTIRFRIEKGVVEVDKISLAGGEITMELSGRIFMSQNIDDYRFNLKGKAKLSKKLEDLLPFLFLIEKQKDPDGNYEVSISGRIGQPSIRVGNFTLPI